MITRRIFPLFWLIATLLLIATLTRIALLAVSFPQLPHNLSTMGSIFLSGWLYDTAVAAYAIVPLAWWLMGWQESWYQPPIFKRVLLLGVAILLIISLVPIIPTAFDKKIQPVLAALFALRLLVFVGLQKAGPRVRTRYRTILLFAWLLVYTALLLLNALSEWFFWEEFGTRYNFIAVDYLIYTNEVLGNIRESYPIVPLILLLLALSAAWLFLWRKPLIAAAKTQIKWPASMGLLLSGMLLPVISFFGVQTQWHNRSNNSFVNALSGNGLYEFGVAFTHNELDYTQFYPTLPLDTAFTILRKELQGPNVTFLNQKPHDITRTIHYANPIERYNVVLISVESLSAEYLSAFGNTAKLTPFIDTLATQGLFFTNCYASGTRTVRGLEAISLAIPPTPGQSVVKWEQKEKLHTLGSVLKNVGYNTFYLYGGYSYFDNMQQFFGKNDYQVRDRNNWPKEKIHYANIWGMADEDLFDMADSVLTQSTQTKQPFFAHIMTVSNHRPYTYPENRVPIPPSQQSREGAIQYTDFALFHFFRQVKKRDWFKHTLFVIVADHCAGSSGKASIPVNRYHIPLIVYAPGILAPKVEEGYMAQMDIAPTLMGLLQQTYTTRFMGRDYFTTPAAQQRLFMGTYQHLGYLQNNQMVVMSPGKKINHYKPNFNSGELLAAPPIDSLQQKAIAYYQCADWLLHHKGYTAIPHQ